MPVRHRLSTTHTPGGPIRPWKTAFLCKADAMNGAMADAHHPNLRLGNAGAQPVACPHLIAVKLECFAFDVDDRKLAFVGGLEPRADIILVNGVAMPRKLFFALAAFDRAHYHPPILSTLVQVTL
jgi:hypothetical protein